MSKCTYLNDTNFPGRYVVSKMQTFSDTLCSYFLSYGTPVEFIPHIHSLHLRSLSLSLSQSSARFQDLHQYLCLAAPLGTPVETTPANLKYYQQSRKAGYTSPKQKVRFMRGEEGWVGEWRERG